MKSLRTLGSFAKFSCRNSLMVERGRAWLRSGISGESQARIPPGFVPRSVVAKTQLLRKRLASRNFIRGISATTFGKRSGVGLTFLSTASLAFAATLAAPLHAAPGDASDRPHIVFLVSSEEDSSSYESARTIPAFADTLASEHGYRTTVLEAEFPESESSFPDIQTVWDADILAIFCRRLALPPDQLTIIKNHVNAGKPVVALKTANHGFAVRGPFVPGHFPWWEFVADVLGAENRGYTPRPFGTDVTVVERNHPIVEGLPTNWRSGNNLYLNTLLDPEATVLLRGKAHGYDQPLAWIRMAGRSKVFYTSLGHPADFDDDRPHFRNLLVNAIRWGLGEI